VRPLLDNGPGAPTASVYVHLPFCRERCLYCSFPTVADDPSAHGPLIDGVLHEASRYVGSKSDPQHVQTLYIGGGTPGLLAPADLRRLLAKLATMCPFQSDVEITLEANPANVTEQSLAEWQQMGVTRLSLGVQTFRDDVLKRLGRRHDAATAERALRTIARGWSRTWSADLLAGWAGESVRDLDADLDRLVEAAPPHVSVYALMVEEGTALAAQRAAGRRVAVSAGLQPTLDARCAERLGQAGFERYEVSNYARPGQRSRHNQVYWADESYLGLGPGAASSIHPHRWVNRADLAGYLEALRCGRSVRTSAELVGPEARLVEVLGVGLRTRDGLTRRRLDDRFGSSTSSAIAAAASALEHADLLRCGGERFAVPEHALARADSIVAELIVQLSALQPAPQCAND
jgi:oxygen-independent coproporphyrinogen-3 oxidase